MINLYTCDPTSESVQNLHFANFDFPKSCVTTSWQLGLQLSSWESSELTDERTYELTNGLTLAISVLVTKGHPPSASKSHTPTHKFLLRHRTAWGYIMLLPFQKPCESAFSNVPLARRLARRDPCCVAPQSTADPSVNWRDQLAFGLATCFLAVLRVVAQS